MKQMTINKSILESEDSARRTAATLVEILMSLMVMSIGLVSVAALFPVSMLRSIQATQLTNASLLNYQCEDYMQAFPQLMTNHLDAVSGTNRPNVEFTPNSIGWSRLGVANIGELRQNLPFNYTVVVDPVGYEYYRSIGQAVNGNRFGTDYFGLHAAGQPRYAIDRKNGGFDLSNVTARNLAYEMFASRDSWSETLKSIEVSKVSATQVTLNDINPSDLVAFNQALLDGAAGRAIVVNELSRQSHVTGVSAVAGQTITLSPALPNNGLYDGIPEVRLELLEPRYTCLVTLREQLVSLGPPDTTGGTTLPPPPGDIGVDDDGNGTVDDIWEIGWPGSDDIVRTRGANLVVFFRRDFSPLGEQAYAVENLTRSSVGLEAQPIRIYWNGANPESKPKLKEGNWVFDPVNGHWYQIRTILEDDVNGVGRTAWVGPNNTRYASIVLDRTAESNAQFVMVPPNVVEVFDFPAFQAR